MMANLLIIPFAVIAVLMFAGFVMVERRNAKRTTCRCCGDRIPPGGAGCAQLGSGFCRVCLTKILRGCR